MRDEKEERKKQARSNKQTRQSNTCNTYIIYKEYIYNIMVKIIMLVNMDLTSLPSYGLGDFEQRRIWLATVWKTHLLACLVLCSIG